MKSKPNTHEHHMYIYILSYHNWNVEPKCMDAPRKVGQNPLAILTEMSNLNA